jgi:DMSO/TMAO reductase YedYZ molybdopterin-dependent catalytic subunit
VLLFWAALCALWTVLDRAGVVGAAKVREQVRQAVLVTGTDGYTAILALGEIAPELEGKQVIVAERMDGQPLSPDHLRIVVPGDKRGARGVHDLARIVVTVPQIEPH